MKRKYSGLLAVVLMLWGAAGWADSYTDTVALFKNAGRSASFFHNSYGYAVFPTVGKGGLVVGAAHGSGRVYRHGKYVGDTTVNQVSVGFQAGGQAYSQIVFFENNAVAITAAAGASAGTAGASADASGGEKDARTAGKYYKGFAIFTIVKGGAMYQAAVAGQKFSYTPRA
jgi:hypothetical protein